MSSTLTLAHAEAIALAHQPAMLAAQLRSQAAAERTREARSGLLPTVVFNASGVRVADAGTSTAAGNITTSSISGRFAYGANLSQLVTDFGRKHALVESLHASAGAQAEMATLSRAQVRLNVRESYFAVLGAEAVLRAAQAALDSRRLVVRQLTALTQSELRSTLDLNFANVLASQAELAVVEAQSNVVQARTHLATAMGQAQEVSAALEDIAATSQPLPPLPEGLQHEAQTQRADLSAAKDESRAATEYAAAEKRLDRPTLNVLAAAGQVPFHDHTLKDNYAAAGFNLSIPVFNGGLFAARRRAAELEAGARVEDEQQVSLVVNEQVHDAWLHADAAYRTLDVTARLVAQSREALRLAQDRYDAGLGSVVELNEAQLNETSAEISAASAVDTYLTRRAELDFAAGLLN
ncbi:TolC family protein [Bryocella elongata]|uniref:TolC family protein n=1 Tax=Bryocella elongata TaxID=863522 RepID=UPI001F2E57A9|nr:TolC family protein [Bryocella elongata]